MPEVMVNYEPNWKTIRATITIVVCIALFKVALVIWKASDVQIVAFLSTITCVGSSSSMEDRTSGLAAFGLVVIVTIALMRIMTSRGR